MANVSHASLSGSELHEPKGISTAVLGTVYVANGSGSGTWADVGTASFTGMVADFVAPIAPSGWLECDGSTVSTSTYSGLYAVMTISTSGTRTNGLPTVTSIASTSTLKAGYYVFGTGIASGTTIVSVDSSTQITLSNNASSSGTAAFAVSPWLLNTGTIKLPDLTTAGRFRRSRTSSTKVGDTQADQNKAHTHTVSASGTTATESAHTHINTLTDPGHAHTIRAGSSGGGSDHVTQGDFGGSTTLPIGPTGPIAVTSTGVTITNASAGSHNHTVTVSGTAATDGGTESRPLAIVFITCVKT